VGFVERAPAGVGLVDETDPDRRVIRLAGGQRGLVKTRELLACGLSERAIAHRVRSGWLIPRHRGVYQVGPVAAPLAAEMAAVLACGPKAVVSHRSAAFLWGLRARHDGPVDVTLLDARGQQRAGIRMHYTRPRAGEVIRRHGIPVTSPARTLLDLTSSLPDRDLARAIEEARVQRLVTRAQLLALDGRGARTIHALAGDAPRYRVIRITWRRLSGEPEAVIAELAAALAS